MFYRPYAVFAAKISDSGSDRVGDRVSEEGVSLALVRQQKRQRDFVDREIKLPERFKDMFKASNSTLLISTVRGRDGISS